MSGQPLGFESCFTAFLVLIAGLTFGLIIMALESFSGKAQTKACLEFCKKHNVGKKLDPEQMENMLAIITSLKKDVLDMEMRLHSLIHQSNSI